MYFGNRKNKNGPKLFVSGSVLFSPLRPAQSKNILSLVLKQLYNA